MILQIATEQPILTNTIVLGIFGTVITGLFVACLGLLRYIWNERKKMFESEVQRRVLEEKKIQQQITEMDDMHDQITTQLATFNETMKNLTGWLKSVAGDQKLMEQRLSQVEAKSKK